jgi:hypothetical protein
VRAILVVGSLVALAFAVPSSSADTALALPQECPCEKLEAAPLHQEPTVSAQVREEEIEPGRKRISLTVEARIRWAWTIKCGTPAENDRCSGSVRVTATYGDILEEEPDSVASTADDANPGSDTRQCDGRCDQKRGPEEQVARVTAHWRDWVVQSGTFTVIWTPQCEEGKTSDPWKMVLRVDGGVLDEKKSDYDGDGTLNENDWRFPRNPQNPNQVAKDYRWDPDWPKRNK